MTYERTFLNTEADTCAFGAQLGRQLQAGDVVILSGPLGAGKTVLTKGIAQGLQVLGPVTSPTYVLARFHPPGYPSGPGMIHVDLYRLIDTAPDLTTELDSLDLDSELDQAVIVVEWGEGIAEQLSSRYLMIHLDRHIGTDQRIATWRWNDNG